MKRTWKLSRGQRVVRNLAAALLLLALALVLAGWPEWMGLWAFRQLEASYLLTPSRVICVNRAYDKSWAAYLTEGEDWITVGRATAVEFEGLPFHRAVPSINHVLPKEGIAVAALPGPNKERGMTVAVWGAPPEAVSGTLEVDLIGVDGIFWECPQKETFSAQGERREDGWVLFQLAGHPEGHGGQMHCAMSCLWDWDARRVYGFVGEHPYRLTLTDVRGGEVLAQSGTLPPNQCLTGR